MTEQLEFSTDPLPKVSERSAGCNRSATKHHRNSTRIGEGARARRRPICGANLSRFRRYRPRHGTNYLAASEHRHDATVHH
jgi:hypothetical protein